MSITNKLNQIKNAIYGKEVRGAIHDAIKECYDDASVNHDNANMEVKMARGTHNTLNDRLDNVDEIQAQTNAQLSQKINVSEIANKMYYNKYNNGCISFIFDDGLQNTYDVVKPIFDRYGIVGSMAVISRELVDKKLDYTMNESQLMDMYNLGWEFICHGHESNFITDSSTDDYAIQEIINSKKIFNNIGINVRGFIPSGGKIPEKFIHYVKDNYDFAFCNYSNDLIDYEKDIFHLNRKLLTGYVPSFFNNLLDEVAANGKWLIFYCHGVAQENAGSDNPTNLSALIENIQNKGIEILTCEKALKKIINLDYSKNTESNLGDNIIKNEDFTTWAQMSSLPSNVDITVLDNLEKRKKIVFSNYPANGYYSIWKDIAIDTKESTIIGEVSIPIRFEGDNRVKVEFKVQGIGNTTPNFSEIRHNASVGANEYKALFAIPKNTDISQLRIRLYIWCQYTGINFTTYIGAPKLIVRYY